MISIKFKKLKIQLRLSVYMLQQSNSASDKCFSALALCQWLLKIPKYCKNCINIFYFLKKFSFHFCLQQHHCIFKFLKISLKIFPISYDKWASALHAVTGKMQPWIHVIKWFKKKGVTMKICRSSRKDTKLQIYICIIYGIVFK